MQLELQLGCDMSSVLPENQRQDIQKLLTRWRPKRGVQIAKRHVQRALQCNKLLFAAGTAVQASLVAGDFGSTAAAPHHVEHVNTLRHAADAALPPRQGNVPTPLRDGDSGGNGGGGGGDDDDDGCGGGGGGGGDDGDTGGVDTDEGDQAVVDTTRRLAVTCAFVHALIVAVKALLPPHAQPQPHSQPPPLSLDENVGPPPAASDTAGGGTAFASLGSSDRMEDDNAEPGLGPTGSASASSPPSASAAASASASASQRPSSSATIHSQPDSPSRVAPNIPQPNRLSDTTNAVPEDGLPEVTMPEATAPSVPVFLQSAPPVGGMSVLTLLRRIHLCVEWLSDAPMPPRTQYHPAAGAGEEEDTTALTRAVAAAELRTLCSTALRVVETLSPHASVAELATVATLAAAHHMDIVRAVLSRLRSFITSAPILRPAAVLALATAVRLAVNAARGQDTFDDEAVGGSRWSKSRVGKGVEALVSGVVGHDMVATAKHALVRFGVGGGGGGGGGMGGAATSVGEEDRLLVIAHQVVQAVVPVVQTVVTALRGLVYGSDSQDTPKELQQVLHALCVLLDSTVDALPGTSAHVDEAWRSDMRSMLKLLKNNVVDTESRHRVCACAGAGVFHAAACVCVCVWCCVVFWLCAPHFFSSCWAVHV